MIITFKSQASADVIYFGDVAYRLIELMGKEPADQGIFTVEQLPQAIARLKAAIAADRQAHRRLVQADEAGSETTPDGGARPRVSLTQRALPLLAMLEESLAGGEPVVWGV
ncbi:MAG: DUF1840 domain-containing protein [Rhodocyclaceae bacterium]